MKTYYKLEMVPSFSLLYEGTRKGAEKVAKDRGMDIMNETAGIFILSKPMEATIMEEDEEGVVARKCNPRWYLARKGQDHSYGYKERVEELFSNIQNGSTSFQEVLDAENS